ncbi:unnamed protein product [Phytophthora fragariaefolia]|uniref:Unnamed protein product n=1 Tax=Phytophthora fragariaefolia TaxID=1490495 RepID=A0A9W6XS28_9STRA|nr:unnamed protein product [Phytophthora fragariaefolia]
MKKMHLLGARNTSAWLLCQQQERACKSREDHVDLFWASVQEREGASTTGTSENIANRKQQPRISHSQFLGCPECPPDMLLTKCVYRHIEAKCGVIELDDTESSSDIDRSTTVTTSTSDRDRASSERAAAPRNAEAEPVELTSVVAKTSSSSGEATRPASSGTEVHCFTTLS